MTRRARQLLAAAIGLALGAAACARRPAPAASPAPHLIEAEAALTDVGVTVRDLGGGAYLAVQESPRGSAANILVVRMQDGTVVFCSSPYDTEATRALVRWARARLSPARMVAINTHFHADGTGGNEGYAAEGVETYASDHTSRLQAARGVAGLLGMATYVQADAPALAARVRATRFTRAAHEFAEAEGLTVKAGAEEARALFVGAGHSADNLVVYFPERGVLFGGCMVRSHPGLGNTADADLDHWATSAEAALALGARVVIPGHGEPGGPELLTATATKAREH
ncbi:MAG: MBL fold metallo-hydrolase [Polyangiaceae bacterium]|nr:MBL fold metallo-hydrolase [Polyangiaceae bacterium]